MDIKVIDLCKLVKSLFNENGGCYYYKKYWQMCMFSNRIAKHFNSAQGLLYTYAHVFSPRIQEFL